MAAVGMGQWTGKTPSILETEGRAGWGWEWLSWGFWALKFRFPINVIKLEFHNDIDPSIPHPSSYLPIPPPPIHHPSMHSLSIFPSSIHPPSILFPSIFLCMFFHLLTQTCTHYLFILPSVHPPIRSSIIMQSSVSPSIQQTSTQLLLHKRPAVDAASQV